MKHNSIADQEWKQKIDRTIEACVEQNLSLYRVGDCLLPGSAPILPYLPRTRCICLVFDWKDYLAAFYPGSRLYQDFCNYSLSDRQYRRIARDLMRLLWPETH